MGFALVIRYGHSLFIHFSSSKPTDGIGKDGDIFMVTENGDSDKQDRNFRLFARAGVTLVVVGFMLQFLDSFAHLG